MPINPDDNSKASQENGTNTQPTGWIQNLFQIGLGDSLLHTVTNLFSITAIIIVIWMAEAYFNRARAQSQINNVPPQAPSPAVNATAKSAAGPIDLSSLGVVREVDIHTNIPDRSRQDVITYVVQQGDTVSGIADKYGLQPKTIFAANYGLLQDDPENLQPGQNLKILPVDGVYWEWLGGIPFAQWAAYFNVKPEDIINYPPNHLDSNLVGDPANANIKVDTWLIVPGGQYQYHTPGQIGWVSRTNPATAQVAGPGACPPSNSSAGGTGTFIYPTDRHYLSGYNYDPKTNHLAIDLAANLGDNIYAADGGLVVYAGLNNFGYGNMVMIDHGNGFQTLYAHLSQIFVSCGQAVNKGEVIGAAGATGHATGPHLHFEVRYNGVPGDPWDFLPPP
ncbi:MAG TPA: peptidoglycan DD-metalloendopeptidase family protein [Anaerolineales bacterium]|nr:peptidoglycan DD-metalloendopeptidase family protein [Anaerolineales bacterium]